MFIASPLTDSTFVFVFALESELLQGSQQELHGHFLLTA